jgi:hypothetical protein
MLLFEQEIEKELCGVTFRFRAPIGETEIKVMECYYNDRTPDGEKPNPVQGMRTLDAVIDTVLIGWKGDGVPVFPEDGHPSKLMPRAVKQTLHEWWQAQMNLGVDEAKN